MQQATRRAPIAARCLTLRSVQKSKEYRFGIQQIAANQVMLVPKPLFGHGGYGSRVWMLLIWTGYLEGAMSLQLVVGHFLTPLTLVREWLVQYGTLTLFWLQILRWRGQSSERFGCIISQW